MPDERAPIPAAPGQGAPTAREAGNCPTCDTAYAAGTRFCASCGLSISGAGRLNEASQRPTAPVGDDALLDPLVHATVGEYDVYGLLGRGGMASVYLALDLALNRKVAIKVISPELADGEDAVARFRQEAQTAAQLNHPNIIPIHTVRRTEDLLFFVMRYVEGRPLDAIIKEVGPLSVEMSRAILGQVGSALQFAHRKGVVHRDVKPANIMIDEDGNAIVTDFGIAKVESGKHLTSTGATVGTPYYMSPEQIAGTKITGSADQYSLGVVAYEMLTGKMPFVGASLMTVMKAHLFDTPSPLGDVRAELPRSLSDSVMRMLEKDPKDRWPDLSEFVKALDAKELPHDSGVRAQMIRLAKSGSHDRLRLSVPVSPMPPVRRTKPSAGVAPPPKSDRSHMVRRALWLVAGTAAIGSGAATAYLFTPIRRTANRPGVSEVAVSPPSVDRKPAKSPAASPSAGRDSIAAVAPHDTGVAPTQSKPKPEGPTNVARGSKERKATNQVKPRGDQVAQARARVKSRPDAIASSPPAIAKPALPEPSGPPQPTVIVPAAPRETTITPAIGQLRIGVGVDHATLEINGQSRGPFASQVRLETVPAGVVRWVVRRAGCLPAEGEVTVAAGSTVTVPRTRATPTCQN